ncbi:MAG: diaminopimelate epimerase [Elusimicrobiota bacterium]
MKLKFSKMQAAGNDFIIIDNRNKRIKTGYGKLAKKLCARKFSVGADGLILVENSGNADFRMVYFNSDGSPAGMCGNGARCVAYYSYLHCISNRFLALETSAGIIKAKITGKRVKIDMPALGDVRQDIKLRVDGKDLDASFINTGVPHTVIISKNTGQVDVAGLGKSIRFHTEFQPAGTNVDFVSVVDRHRIKIRTYERGVEEETYACGTGAVAGAVISGLKNMVVSPVECGTSGGETLVVYFRKKENGLITNVSLAGPVHRVFDGICCDE